MKKTIIIILAVLIIVLALFVGWYNQALSEKRLVSNYNSEYEQYIEETITGVDLTTVINKAVDNNETYSIEKDENSLYINDENYCTEVYIKLAEEGDFFAMEAFYEVRNRRIYISLW